MPSDPKRRPLKIEPDPSADNPLEQLLESLRRIESGLGAIHEVVVRIDTRAKEDADGRR